MGYPTGIGVTEAIARSPSRAPSLALIDRQGEVVRLTEAFREGLAAEGAPRVSIWDFITDPDQRSLLSRVLDGELLRADITLAAAAGPVAVEAEAVLDVRFAPHALLTVSSPGPDADRQTGMEALANDASLDESAAIVWITDLGGRFLRVNQRYSERLGIDAVSIRGKTDAELSPAHIVDGRRLPRPQGDGEEPVQLEYTVESLGERPALTVLRFPVRDLEGAPIAVCRVAAPIPEAAIARAEGERLLRAERWARLSDAAIRAEVLDEWKLSKLVAEPVIAPEPAVRPMLDAETAADAATALQQLAPLREELAAERGVNAELERSLGAERAAKAELERSLEAERAAMAELGRSMGEERATNVELETSLDRARAANVELETSLRQALGASAELDRSLVAERAAKADIEQSLDAERAAKAQLERDLDAERAAKAQLERDLDAERAAKAQLERNVGEERARVAGLQATVGAADRRVEELERLGVAARGQIATLDAALASEHSRVEELERARTKTSSEADRAGAVNDARAELERHLADAQRRAEEAERTCAAERETAGQTVAELLARAERAEAATNQVRAEGEQATVTSERAQAAATRARAAAELSRARADGLETALAIAREAEAAAKAETAAAVRAEAAAKAEAAGNAQSAANAQAAAVANAEAAAKAKADAAEATAKARAAEAEARARAETGAKARADAEAESREGLERARAEIAALRFSLAQAQVELETSRAGAVDADARLERELHSAFAGRAPAAPEIANPVAATAATSPLGEPVAPISGPAWSHGAQRALTASLARAVEWRSGLKEALRILGSEGGWDVVVAWCPDEPVKALRCAAMWPSGSSQLGLFETATWQRRPLLATSEVGIVAGSGRSAWLVDLTSARDAQIAAAASAGMRAALLVPIRHGDVTIGVLELLTRAPSPPNPELIAATEAIAIQLAHFDYLLRRGAEPRWKLGRI